jgi:Protein of unknown function (DUF4238)
MPIGKTNRPEGQHFVQKAYLKNFCDPNGKLNAYLVLSRDGSSLESKWIEGTPEKLGKENNIYTLQDGSPFCMEEHFQGIEDAGMAAIHRMLAGRLDVVAPADADGLMPYIAYAATRVPAALKLKKIMEPEMKAGRIAGEPINPGSSGIPKEAEAISRKLREFKLYPRFFDGRPQTLLATSDRPVGLFALADGRTQLLLPVDSSLPDCWANEVVCTFPISTQCVVLGIRGLKGKLNEVLKGVLSLRSHEQVAGWVNAMTAFQANQVYSCSRDTQFLALGATRKLVGIEEFVMATTAYMEANTEKWPVESPSVH